MLVIDRALSLQPTYIKREIAHATGRTAAMVAAASSEGTSSATSSDIAAVPPAMTVVGIKDAIKKKYDDVNIAAALQRRDDDVESGSSVRAQAEHLLALIALIDKGVPFTRNDLVHMMRGINVDVQPTALLKKQAKKLTRQIGNKVKKLEKFTGRLKEKVQAEMESMIIKKEEVMRCIALIGTGGDLTPKDLDDIFESARIDINGDLLPSYELYNYKDSEEEFSMDVPIEEWTQDHWDMIS